MLYLDSKDLAKVKVLIIFIFLHFFHLFACTECVWKFRGATNILQSFYAAHTSCY